MLENRANWFANDASAVPCTRQRDMNERTKGESPPAHRNGFDDMLQERRHVEASNFHSVVISAKRAQQHLTAHHQVQILGDESVDEGRSDGHHASTRPGVGRLRSEKPVHPGPIHSCANNRRQFQLVSVLGVNSLREGQEIADVRNGVKVMTKHTG